MLFCWADDGRPPTPSVALAPSSSRRVSRVKIAPAGADSQGMADARLGLLRTAPPLATGGSVRTHARRLAPADGDLGPDQRRGVGAHRPRRRASSGTPPFERLLAGQDPHGTYVVPPGRGRQAPVRHRARRSRARPAGADGAGRGDVGELRAGAGVRSARRRGAPHARARRGRSRLRAGPLPRHRRRRLGSGRGPVDHRRRRRAPHPSRRALPRRHHRPPGRARRLHQPRRPAHGRGEVARGRHRQADHVVHQPRRPHEHDRPPGPAQGPRRRGEGLRGHDGARRRQPSCPSRWRAPARAGVASPPSRSSCATSRSASWPRRRPRPAPPSSGATRRPWPPSKRASS